MNTIIKKSSFAAILLFASLLTMVLIVPVNAQNVTSTVGCWHLDEIVPQDYQEITPDETGVNNGILGVNTSNMLVEGKFDKALYFDGHNFVYLPIAFLVGFPPSPQPIYIPISSSLDVQQDVKIEAWINLQGYTEAAYNNIVVKCTRDNSSWESTTRLLGLAIRSGISENGIDVPAGTLCGFLTTDSSGYNEIVTTTPVINLNEWTHVSFERTSSGMRLYVNGYEQSVKAVFGSQNPRGSITNGTEVYFGHDSKVIIDEVKITDLNLEVQEDAFDIGPNLMTVVIAVSAIFAIAWLLRRAIQLMVFRSKP
ncbi:MAG: LamG domain-containing protein [Crenarchaeota archaeon]|nr:LamG domain-containing protein [Thermoproteota archaeon]